MQANGMVGVWLDVAADDERELNEWYETEHLKHVVDLDGFVSGHRYFCPHAPHRYLVLYETVDHQVEPGPAFQGIVAQPTPWTLRIRSLFKKQLRTNHIRTADRGESGTHGPVVIVLSSGGAMDEGKGLPAGCARYRAFTEANKEQARMVVYDFADMESAAAASARLQASTDRQVWLYQPIGRPYIRQQV